MRLFASKHSRKLADKIIIAVGGGKVIDEAKIYAKRHHKVCVAFPTTGSGASETTHAVRWGKEKINIPTDKPIGILLPFKIKLSKEARINTIYDILGHVVDYLNVASDNEIIEVGMYSGRLIEKHHTNLTHPRSYPLTLKNKIPHGRAVGMVLCDCIKEAFPL
jgi:alcohol dehydrogenase class IV